MVLKSGYATCGYKHIYIYIYYLKHLKHGRFAIFFYHQDYFTWLSYSDLRNVHDCSSCTSKLPNTSLEAIEQLYYPVISGLVDKPLYGSLSFPTRIQWKVRNFFFRGENWSQKISENHRFILETLSRAAAEFSDTRPPYGGLRSSQSRPTPHLQAPQLRWEVT